LRVIEILGDEKMNKRFTKNLILLLAISLILFISGCRKETIKIEKIEKHEGGNDMALEQLKQPQEGEEIVVIITNHGEIKIRLFSDIAPKAVENFKTHAKDGYYDGVTFHRVIKDFMIQGGDPDGTGMGGKSIWEKPFEDEFNKDYHNLRGSLSMANAGPGTNGSQFFIVQRSFVEEDFLSQMKQAGDEAGFSEDVINAYAELGGTPWLDYRHTVFGQVFQGMDIVDKIANLEVGANDKPVNPVVMEKVEIRKIEYK